MDGIRKCRQLAGTGTEPDGYTVVMDYRIRDEDDQETAGINHHY